MEEKPVQLIVQNCPTPEEDEIDLKELWQTIKQNRKIIYITTGLFFFLALIYIFTKTPLYEAKSLLEIGYIGDKPIQSADVVAQKIKTVFYVDDPALRSKMDREAFVQNAEPVRKLKNLIRITTYGISNEKAVKKAKEVITYVQKDEAPKIEHFKKDIQAQIDKITRDIEKLKNIEIKKIEDKIALAKEQDVKKIEEHINLIKNIELKKIEDKINLIKNIELKKIDDKINLIKNIELKKIEDKINLIKNIELKKIDDQIKLYLNEIIPNIEKKIAISERQIEKFEKNIENLQKSILNTQDPAFKALTLVQISNYQNMIYNRQLKINDLELQKEKILKETIPNLQRQKEKILKETIPNLQRQKEKILKETIPNLQRQKEKILKETIPNLQRQKEKILKETIPNLQRQKEKILKETIPNLQRQKEKILKIDIPKLQDNIVALKYKLTDAYISPTKAVGDIQTYDKPKKPKKKLILAVSVITGVILGIFLIFLIQFFREENDKSKEKK